VIEQLHFCATGRKGLGHLRRITNIVRVLKQTTPRLSLSLVTNAPPAGMTAAEAGLFEDISVVERSDMAGFLAEQQAQAVVIDTAVLPGISQLDARLGLLLRETREAQLHRFALEQDRQWDLLMIPNPADHWQPDPQRVPARYTETVGWIYRRSQVPPQQPGETVAKQPRILVASGGGGGAGEFLIEVERLINALKNRPNLSLAVSQVIGPRASADAAIAAVDEYLRPGPNLHELFSRFDLVISAAGYNSTLELACTDVPVLFIPIKMTYDDQAVRARYWASCLGHCHDAAQLDTSLDWVARVLTGRQRRTPIDLGTSGATTASEVITRWLQ